MTLRYWNYDGIMDWTGNPGLDEYLDTCAEACVACFVELQDFVVFEAKEEGDGDLQIPDKLVQLARYTSRQCQATVRMLKNNQSHTYEELKDTLARCYLGCESFRNYSHRIDSRTVPYIVGRCELLSEECAIACDEMSEEWFGKGALD